MVSSRVLVIVFLVVTLCCHSFSEEAAAHDESHEVHEDHSDFDFSDFFGDENTEDDG